MPWLRIAAVQTNVRTRVICACVCVCTHRHRCNATGFSRDFVLVYRFTVTQGISVERL
jgi:hypothetical protein